MTHLPLFPPPPSAARAPAGESAQAAVRTLSEASPDPALASVAWAGVPADSQLLPPHACRALWRQLESDVSFAVSQARTAQDAAERASAAGYPLWVFAAFLALGYDEVIWLLRHPVYLTLIALIALFGRAVVSQIDVAGAMRLGVVPGLMLIFSKAVPAVLVVVQKLACGHPGYFADILPLWRGGGKRSEIVL